MSGLILTNVYEEHPVGICMQTFRKTCITNEQRTILTEQEVDVAQKLEQQFGSKFKGEPTAMYNCHGLTFASRRTGIYDTETIMTILKEEYREVKTNDVIEGDIVIYYLEDDIAHSAVVIGVDKDSNLVIPVIRVLSKIRYYKEIVHLANMSPYGTSYKFFRINHNTAAIYR